ncbi:hypothetical protein N7499_002590 [Penicillium canescens]|nr:hypothetical protein N7499_002590 [Penicillium canescens]KAJ6166204.1 hypothetical protein N7485_009448 [Penicillium canescens]
MDLVERGPFSQLGRFDPHDGCRHITEDLERYVNKLPVQRCIDYSLGILRTPKRGGRRIIIPAATSAESDGPAGFCAWMAWPSAAQLDQIKYTLEQLLSISGADILEYSIETTVDIEYERETMERVNPDFSLGMEKIHQTVLVAHALAALQPWGLLPVLPTHFAEAFKPFIAPFVGSRLETVTVLQERMCDMRLKPLPGWDTIEQQAMALSQMGDIKTSFFSASNSPCRQYFKAMNMVFDAYRLPLADVRNKLAAIAASKLLEGDKLSELFVDNMAIHLGHGQLPAKIPDWAISLSQGSALLGHRLEDQRLAEEEQSWNALADGMRAVGELMQSHKADGPFVLGAQPTYTGFFIAGSLQSARVVHESGFHRISKYPGYKEIYEACLPYMDKKD